MRVSYCLVALCLWVAFCSGQWTDSTWTDTRFGGGIMFLCFDDDDLSGAYSELGIVQGKRQGDRVTGNFYEVGSVCTSGTFEWEISADGDSFTGSFACDDSSTPLTWSETRTGGSSATNDRTCAVLSGSSVSGRYVDGGDQLDICVDDDEFDASLDDGSVKSYERGVAFLNGAVASGGILRTDGNQGIALYFRLKDGSLGKFVWIGDYYNPFDFIEDYDNSQVHQYLVYDRSGSATGKQCGSNVGPVYEGILPPTSYFYDGFFTSEYFTSSYFSNSYFSSGFFSRFVAGGSDSGNSSNSSNSSDDDDSNSTSRNSSDDDDNSGAGALVASMAILFLALV